VVVFGLVALLPADAGATGPGWNGKHHDPWKHWGDGRDHGHPHFRGHHQYQYRAPVYVVPSHAQWVPGYWGWNGYQWVWVPGYWVW